MSRTFNSGLLATGLLAAGLWLGMATASATTISASVGGVPSAADCYENFASLSPGPTGGTTTACSIGVSFGTDGQVVQGAVSGKYAAPFLSNNNGTLFGDTNNGADTTNYLTSGSTGAHSGAGATLTFPTQERYLGLLWGSVDNYNTLTFYLGATQVASFTGTDVSNVAGTGNCTGGDQGQIGTCYVNITLSSPFDTVIATSSNYAFEFDNVAFAKAPVGVPEPGIVGLFALGLLLVGSGCWYRKRAAA